ncbi:ribonuclease E [Inquilinus ginsengisoli]|uniref:Ribonuclease E n=3 Tax=Inquilinus TaxID=171673 RepID=A0ABU1JY78_9PROT|nr:ribonuclease E/G [Inquilinus ginsengisoli]MDR6293574.1 ribonuclease E [Inquilinus ginsengisoli]
MAKRMLVDATHAEETRVVVLDGNRLEEFDFETEAKKQLKGNIYLAKVTRVEPSLQAAFVEYGGNRHGFLAFSEIHPDYYRIPIADRDAILARQAAEADEAEAPAAEAPSAEPAPRRRRGRGDRRPARAETAEAGPSEAAPGEATDSFGGSSSETPGEDVFGETVSSEGDSGPVGLAPATEAPQGDDPTPAGGEDGNGHDGHRETSVEVMGGDEAEEARDRRSKLPNYRNYKIQEVIKRRQIMLVQVTKEERGNKGAALTTYLSLAGRYCVLMPNTPRGGGISRKIANPKDRKKMKAIMDDLDVPEGMAVILRTAGLERTKLEIRRDLDYLLRLWDSIRQTTLQSTAPCAIHEEANLIKRAIRDLYSKDIDDVQVAGEEGYRTAKDFMRMLMPSHAKKVQPYLDQDVPLFHRFNVEGQIDAMHSPVVQLRSGGYIVINPTEALVSIDVNSGRSTRERNIEETAYKTNLEAADEVARQLRLRDLAGLIVIDFIDMEDDRHNKAVEHRLKEAMRQDRARIQLGRISAFGLLELSRQRLRPSLMETHFETCAHCGGLGMTRTTGSAALSVLRAIEEEGIRKRASEVTVHVATAMALYLLNQKRDALADIERRYAVRVLIEADDSLIPPAHRIERTRARVEELPGQMVVPIDNTARIMAETDAAFENEVEEDEVEVEEAEEPVQEQRQPAPQQGRQQQQGRPPQPRPEQSHPRAAEGDGEGRGGKRRRRRRGRRRGDEGHRADQPAAVAADGSFGYDPRDGEADDGRGIEPFTVEAGDAAAHAEPETEAVTAEVSATDVAVAEVTVAEAPVAEAAAPEPVPADIDAAAAAQAEDDKARRRGRRGGRRRKADDAETVVEAQAGAVTEAPAEPVAAVVEAPVVEAVVAEAAPAEAEAPKPKRRAPRRKKTDPVVEVAAEPAPEPVAEEAAAEPAAAAPVNGAAPVEPAAAPEPEPVPENLAVEANQVVNQPPEAPKRGWWRRSEG